MSPRRMRSSERNKMDCRPGCRRSASAWLSSSASSRVSRIAAVRAPRTDQHLARLSAFGRTIGDPDSKVAVVEYSDYQ